MTSFDHIANNKVEANFHKDKIIALCDKFESNSNNFYERAKDLLDQYNILWEEYFSEYRKISDKPYYYHWTPVVHHHIFVNNSTEIYKIRKIALDCDKYLILSADTYNHLEMITSDHHIDYEITCLQYAIRSLEFKLANLKKFLKAIERSAEKEYDSASDGVNTCVLFAAAITVAIIGVILCFV